MDIYSDDVICRLCSQSVHVLNLGIWGGGLKSREQMMAREIIGLISKRFTAQIFRFEQMLLTCGQLCNKAPSVQTGSFAGLCLLSFQYLLE